jgi:hypothetical protein
LTLSRGSRPIHQVPTYRLFSTDVVGPERLAWLELRYRSGSKS